jgi:two-component system LytT family response regulator
MKAVIIGAERMARIEMRRLLAAHLDIEIAGEAANGEEAALGRKYFPDLLFSISRCRACRGLNCSDGCRIFRESSSPRLTTSMRFASLRSILSIICSSLSPRRGWRRAFAKVRGRRHKPHEQILLREGERCWILRLAEIELLESEGNYTRVFVPEVVEETDVMANTIHKAIRGEVCIGRQLKKANRQTVELRNKTERSQIDSEAPMGYATTQV